LVEFFIKGIICHTFRLPAMKLAPLPIASTASSALNVRLISLTALVFRCPSPVPVRTSFGIMRDRPAVFVRAESADGHVGWGEVWCNFPACGAEHRANLLETVVAPLLLNKDFSHPAYAFEEASSKTHVLALQSGELGPMAQVIAGVDIALWDLCARRAKLPLYQLLGGTNARIGVYASGINPDGALQTVQKKHQEGFRAFKLKIGFDTEQDIANLRSVREWLGPSLELMADVNQAWDLAQALDTLPKLAPYGLRWLEEPLRCDSEMHQWQALKAHSRIPLAAGENMLGSASFMSAMDSQAFDVLQPDIAKWGGISATWAVIQNTLSRGLRYCPHYLGAGIGLMASAHLLAAAGGDGLLEVDANENPLRTLLAPALQKIDNGFITLTQDPGLGVEPDLDALAMACQQS
jgi:L-alanine-DL-glutamate epimerase-like enolase superfamily enzyme